MRHPEWTGFRDSRGLSETVVEPNNGGGGGKKVAARSGIPTEAAMDRFRKMQSLLADEKALKRITPERRDALRLGKDVRRIKTEIQVAELLERNVRIDKAALEGDQQNDHFEFPEVAIPDPRERLLREVIEEASVRIAEEDDKDSIQGAEDGDESEVSVTVTDFEGLNEVADTDNEDEEMGESEERV